MPHRSYASTANYRFGFNGKENDNEPKGLGNQQDYGMRIYDPRLGRFLSIDKLQTSFPDLTPYQFSGNTPIQAIDLDGLEPKGFMQYWEQRTEPYMTKWGYTVQDFYDYESKQVWTVMNYPNTSQYYYWQTKYENSESLFKPLNTTLNKDIEAEWTGKFTEFKPKRLSEDRSFDMFMVGVLSVPFVAVYGKAILLYLGSEVLEELAGVPIPDGPVDLWKYQMKAEAKREIAEKAMKNVMKSEYEGMEYLDDGLRMVDQPFTVIPKKIDKPDGWIEKTSKKGEGVVFQDPTNSHNSIRIMPGNKKSPNVAQQNPYVIFKKDGVAYDKDGIPLKNSSDPAAHIPVENFDIKKMPKS